MTDTDLQEKVAMLQAASQQLDVIEDKVCNAHESLCAMLLALLECRAQLELAVQAAERLKRKR